jgi:hypothetical protein
MAIHVVDFDAMERQRPRHREEELYVSEEYKIFMIAGTPDGFTHDKNHISVRPFNAMPAGTIEAMRAIAKPWTTETQKECDSTLRIADLHLELVDGYSGVTSKFPISELDEDVRASVLYNIRMRIFNGGSDTTEVDPWKKYFNEASTVQVPSPDVSTTQATSVQKPLTLKKGGLNL